MEIFRKAVESRYCDSCTIYVRENSGRDENGVTKKEINIICENEKCRISFGSSSSTSDSGHMTETINQTIELLIAPEIEVPEGSTILVTHFGKMTGYHMSGSPSVYSSHQEIILVPIKKEA